ncbi:hypothetical protein [Streptomyces sp. NPDC052107]|uniref:hypothetical protein n=1 Tax=Streptomyces sp. NPDC052107 TaxID=3155632 RepID=UPI00344804A3
MADHRVKPCTVAAYEMRHPLLGPLTVVQQTMSSGRSPLVVVATTQAGSPSLAALALLAQATSESTAADRSLRRRGADTVPHRQELIPQTSPAAAATSHHGLPTRVRP